MSNEINLLSKNKCLKSNISLIIKVLMKNLKDLTENSEEK